MTDDIVTRLRDKAEERQEALDEYWRGHKFDYDLPMLENEAADEIERLRADRDRWRELADSLARFGNCESPDCPDCDRDWKLTYESYDKAVRGE